MLRRALAGLAIAAVWIGAIPLKYVHAQQPPPQNPPAAAPASAATDISTMSGVYTEKQASKGSDDFANLCTSCHTTSSHKGAPFKKRWEGYSAWDLLETISTTMPKDDEGSLTMDQVTELVAYLFKLNGMPAGDKDLPEDEAALKKIRIELPKTH